MLILILVSFDKEKETEALILKRLTGLHGCHFFSTDVISEDHGQGFFSFFFFLFLHAWGASFAAEDHHREKNKSKCSAPSPIPNLTSFLNLKVSLGPKS